MISETVPARVEEIIVGAPNMEHEVGIYPRESAECGRIVEARSAEQSV